MLAEMVGTVADLSRVAPVITKTFEDQRVYRTLWAIPNMGYTEPRAYDNRLIWACRAGAEDERARHDDRSVRYEPYFGTVGRILTPYAREILAEKAVEMGMDLVFMVDDDMLGSPTTFFDLAENVVNGPADVCGALAFTRNPPYDPVLYTCIEGRDPIDGSYFVNTPVKRYPKDALVEVDAVGFGAVVFKTVLLSRMKRPWFMSTCGSGEDIYWCYKAKREAGARIFADTRVKLGHIGSPVIIDEATYESFNAMDDKRARDGDETKYSTLDVTPKPWEIMR